MYGISVFSNPVVSIYRYYSSGNSKKLLEILANMPKANSTRIASAQRQRQVISKKSEKYGPSTVYLQVLGSGAKGAPNTLYLFTDQKRYMFNCGECTQRLAHEHKVKLSKLDHIFITRKTWRNIGGLPGLSLTLQDVGVPNITLHGPEGLDELYNATKRFVIMKDMNVTMAKSSSSKDFEDNVMTVKYVLLAPLNNILGTQALKQSLKKSKPEINTEHEFEEFIHDDTDYYNSNRHVVNKEKVKLHAKSSLTDKDPMKQKAEKLLQNLQKHEDCSVAYICTLKKRLGTLDLAKCVELGVKPGPILGQLKSGIDVVLPNGNLVRSKDVKSPDDPGPVFIVLDVPDASYIQELEFRAHFDNGTNPSEKIPALIVHFTPPHVFQHPTYTSFISKFGPSTQHLILNSSNSCLGSEAVHRTQHKLHLLDPDIFPLLRDVSVPAVWNSTSPLPKADSPVKLKCLEELKNKIAFAQFQNIINLEGSAKGEKSLLQGNEEDLAKLNLMAGRTLTMYHLRPKREIDRSAEPKLHVQEYIQETMNVDGFADSLEQFRQLVDGIKYAKSDNLEYPKVVFLGTGSCIPSKTRNTSAIAVQIDEAHSMLLDCGEGTFGQLVRFYGPKKVNAFLRTLKAIYISHLHADHHIGLIGVLQARRAAFEELPDEHHLPVYLLAPGQIVSWLSLYDQQFETIKDKYTLIPNQSLLQDAVSPSAELTSAGLAAMGVSSVRTCRVAHCPNAFGVALQIRGQKLTYSGDTLPCADLVTLGENSTLLIHEATMEDELAEEARTKMHSTTTQAIEVGRQMNARFTVLTHFSQRYARLPRLNANILNNNRTVGIAFDNMQISMNDLGLLPHMYAPLQLMFAEHCVEMELKAAHRQLREKRESSPSGTHTPKRLRDGLPVNKKSVSSPTRRRSPSPSKHSSPPPSCRKIFAPRQAQEIPGRTLLDVTNKQQLTRSRSPGPSEFLNINCNTRSAIPAKQENTDPIRAKRGMTQPQSVQVKAPRQASMMSPSAQSTPPPHQSRPKQSSCARSYSTNEAPCQPNPGTRNRLESAIANRSPQQRQPSSKQPRSRSCSLSPSSKRNPSPSTIPFSTETPVTKPRLLQNPAAIVNKPPPQRPARPKQPRSRSSSLSPSPKRNASTNNTTVNPKYLSKDLMKQYGICVPKPTELETDNRTDRVSAFVHQSKSEAIPGNRLPTQGNIFNNKCRVRDSNPLKYIDSKIPILKKSINQKYSSPANKILQGNAQEHIKALSSEPSGNSSDICDKDTSRSSLDSVKTQIFGNSIAGYKDMKPQFETRTPPRPQQTRTTVMRSSIKHYQPQLEDIKSSYLLMNEREPTAQLKRGTGTVGKPRVSTQPMQRNKKLPLSVISRPSPLDEAMRQKQLLEAKKKFSSKRFIYDSKYDKIEGLNWITWK